MPKAKRNRKLTPAALEKLALELLTYLQKNELFNYVYIYVNGDCYSDHRIDGNGTQLTTDYGAYYHIPNQPVREIMDYCNPETISVRFDGDLYYELNQSDGRVADDLNRMFKKHNMYFDQGYPSDFSLYYDFD